MKPPAPKVLHVIDRLDRGGVESWLMNVMRGSDRSVLPMDVCLLTRDSSPCDYEEEFVRLGGRVIRCPRGEKPWSFGRRFRRVLRHGQYDVLHSHVHLFSGYLLRLAAAENVPTRIAHSHSDTRILHKAATLPRRAYERLMRRWLQYHATHGLACGDFAARAMFGEDWRSDPRWRLLSYGIDLAPFRTRDREGIRQQLGLTDAQLAIVHVGRLVEVKNHAFLLEVADVLRKLRPDFRMFFVGDGALRADIERGITERNLAGWVRCVGARSDVPQLLAGFDLFVLPSHYEGFPVSVIEAQAAGLPSILSGNISPEVNVIPGMVRHVDLTRGAEAWARACLEMSDQRQRWTPSFLDHLAVAGFSAEASLNLLVQTYNGLVNNNAAGPDRVPPFVRTRELS
jgi:glycosyltransferase involved in cell wall biosynthesis